MKFSRVLAGLFSFILLACQPATLSTITIIDYDRIITLQTDERIPSRLLSQAGIILGPNDQVLVNGLPTAPGEQINSHPVTLQVRRAMTITVNTPDGEQQIHSSAFTVGEALTGTLSWLRAGDKIDQPLHIPLSTLQSPIFISPSRHLTITTNTETIQVTTTAQTIGEALAEAGVPLLGLDYSIPPEKEPLPPDEQIKVVRVNESVLLTQKPIPFDSDFQASAEVPLDQTQIIQPGETGLTVQRIRIRYEDGEEISRLTGNETMVRPPKMRILGYGTNVEVKTAVVDGVEIEYWRAVQMYATSYSPCRSGADRCYPGTSSGKSLRKGMVAMRYDWYLAMGGQPLYIPGYGFATIEDVCGGCTGRPWIDLGYSDNNWQQWSSWVTVYFLTPVPQNIIYVLE
jgi:uncharacterized protein YabE (DUF348 family)